MPGERFTWFEKFSDVCSKIPEVERERFVVGVAYYGAYGIEPDFGYPLDAIFEGVRDDIDIDKSSYAEEKDWFR